MSRRPATHRRHGSALVVLGVVLALVAAACSGGSGGGSGGSGDGQALRLTALSTRPQYVTNGDVLVGIDSPSGQSLDDVKVEVGGRDVSEVFRPDEAPYRAPGSPTRLVGLVSGLTPGENTITARSGSAKASLVVEDHPVDGPLFSGPQQSPFVCTTGKNGLGPPEDQCWARSQVRWMYRAADGTMSDLADPAVTPSDVSTITVDGRTVPFVVRIETGVFNRSVTTFAVLDPRPGAPAGTTPGPTPVRAWDSSAWNGRLVYRFGGGCGATYSQGDDLVNAAEPNLLAQGYAVIASTLTTFETACNDVVAAETVMVAKEHFSEAYGLPRYTIGEGGSGGAIQQLLIAQNYPGLLDAVAPSIPFPDAVSIAGGVADCGLLGRYLGDTSGVSPAAAAANGTGGGAGSSWTDAQRLAVTGFASPNTCALWRATYLENIDPSVGCDQELVDAGQVYDPRTNPRGARCTFQDSNVNEFGTDRDTGFAQRPLDNVGVQYGLEALRAGTITADQFLDLNEGIGGYDIDGRWQAARTRASDDVLARSYEGGRITAGSALGDAGALSVQGAGGLVDVPVLLVNLYTDPLGDIHDRQRIYEIADRLRLPDGSANPNVVRWTLPGAADLQSLILAATGNTGTAAEVVRTLDAWLTAADDSAAAQGTPVPRVGDIAGTGATAAGNPDATVTPAPSGSPLPTARAALLAASRPAGTGDRCTLPDGRVVNGPESYVAGSACEQAYPVHADPRQAAGAPQAGSTVACSLVPVDPSADRYGVTFTAAQADRLRRIFPDGVCDWSRPGRGQTTLAGTWQGWDR